MVTNESSDDLVHRTVSPELALLPSTQKKRALIISISSSTLIPSACLKYNITHVHGSTIFAGGDLNI